MRHSTSTFVLLCLATIACGSSDREVASTSLQSLAGGDPSDGSWKTREVSRTPGTISHDGRLAFSPSGRAIALWSEPDQKDYAIQNIWTASLEGDAWSTTPALTTNNATQNAFASVVAAGDAVHVVWNGSPGGDHDIFHVQLSGGAWSGRTDLTSAFKTEEGPTTDYLPSLAASPKGGLAVAYNSKTVEEGAIGIRVLRLGADGAPAGTPTLAIPAPSSGGDCYGAAAEFDAAGHLHVVAECGPIGEEHLVWGTDASGSWVVTEIAAQGQTDVQAQLARGASGTLELVWVAFTACSSGNACGDILAATIDGTRIGPARFVTNTPGANETKPLAAVDKTGRLIVAYSMNRDAFVVASTGPTTFGPPTNLSPDSAATWEYPSAVAVDPISGAPHVLFTKVFPQTRPLNAEIVDAYWVPATR